MKRHHLILLICLGLIFLVVLTYFLYRLKTSSHVLQRLPLDSNVLFFYKPTTTVDFEGGTCTLNYKSPHKWNITASDDWIDIIKTSNSVVTFIVRINRGKSDRVGYIQFRNQEHSFNSVVKQTANPYISEGRHQFIKDIHFPSPKLGYAVIFDPVSLTTLLMKSIDNGKTWQDISPKQETDLDKVFFLNENTGWVACKSGKTNLIQKTTDGGKNWKQYLLDPVPDSASVNQLYFWDETAGFIVLSKGYRYVQDTTDGGKTWLNRTKRGYQFGIELIPLKDRKWVKEDWEITLPGTKDLADQRIIPLIDMCYTDSTHVWGISGSVWEDEREGMQIYHSSDGTKTWTLQYDNSSFTSLSIRFANTGFGVCLATNESGNLTVLSSQDWGKHWKQTTSIFDTMRMVKIVDVSIFPTGVCYVTVNKSILPEEEDITEKGHITTAPCRILYSANFGKTWEIITPN